MANPTSLLRSQFYGIEMTPGFVIDGEKETGGGALREKARIVYDRIQPVIEKRLETVAGAEIKLEAVLDGASVKVRATVDKVRTESKSPKLRFVLVEDELRYSGENLVRIHPMVVRSLSHPLALNPATTTTIEYTFNLEKITAALRAYLDDYEVNGDYGPITFKEKKYQIDSKNLSVVAFVQDEISKRVLQAAYFKVKVKPTATARK
jgi:hypothetical protein